MPTYNLTRRPTVIEERSSLEDKDAYVAAQRRSHVSDPLDAPGLDDHEAELLARPRSDLQRITSALSESRFGVFPHGVSLEGCSEEDKAELNDHVRHLLHSRREKFKRSMKGFRQYISHRKLRCLLIMPMCLLMV